METPNWKNGIVGYWPLHCQFWSFLSTFGVLELLDGPIRCPHPTERRDLDFSLDSLCLKKSASQLPLFINRCHLCCSQQKAND